MSSAARVLAGTGGAVLSVAQRVYRTRAYVLFARTDRARWLAAPEGITIEIIPSAAALAERLPAWNTVGLPHLDRLAARFRGGSVLCVARRDTRVLHTTWVARRPAEVFDDAVLARLSEAPGLYIGPCVTVPEARGLGLYPAVLDHVCAELLREGTAWINTARANHASRLGIMKAGFLPTSLLTRWTLLGVDMWSEQRAASRHDGPLVWFRAYLTKSGGGERLALESLTAMRRAGVDARIVAFQYEPDKVFEGRYDVPVIARRRHDAGGAGGFGGRLIARLDDVRWARRAIAGLKPVAMLSSATWAGQAFDAWSVNAGGHRPLGLHIFGSVFASQLDLTKYGVSFRTAFDAVRRSLPSYEAATTPRPPAMSATKRVKLELHAAVKWIATRRADVLFALSRRNRWEVKQLYGRTAVVLKGAFPARLLEYVPATNARAGLGLPADQGVVLSVCRLVDHKRVDLAIRALAAMTDRSPVLLVGGTGPEGASLEALSRELGVADRVRFLGYVSDAILWDLMAAADIFVSLDLADFDIAPLEALALGCRVVWTTEMETDPGMRVRTLLVAEPHALAVAEAFTRGFALTRAMPEERRQLYRYSWESYADQMLTAMGL